MAFARDPRPPSSLSTASIASNAIDRLSEMFKCRKCGRKMKDPRQLPCHHTFCTECILELINTAKHNEFLCPLDRTVVPVPPGGVSFFPQDEKIRELEEIRIDLENGIMLEDQENADLDISLESLNKGVKDVEHSSALTQHEVNEIFEKIYKTLKKKQEQIIRDIKCKSKNQIMLLEYEKYRLIEVKKFQNAMINDSFRDNRHINQMHQMFDSGSISDSKSQSPSTVQTESHILVNEPRLSLMSCHIGHQHLQFQSNESALQNIENDLNELGKVVCDFDLKVKLDRNLLTIDEFPFGMKICGNENSSEWLANQPKGISKRSLSTSFYVVNNGRSEIIQMDNNFNTIRVISGRGLFSNNITDVASCGGNIYVVDSGACRIVMLNEKDGNLVRHFGRPGSGNLELRRPHSICIDSKGRVIVSDSLNHRIKVYTPDLRSCLLTFTTDRKKFQESKRFSFPCGVAVDKDDNIYIVDTNNKRLVQLARDGRFLKEIYPSEVDDPRCIAVSSDERIILTDRENAKVLIIDPNGQATARISGISDSYDRRINFKQPYGVAVDGTDKVYITDTERNAVFVV